MLRAPAQQHRWVSSPNFARADVRPSKNIAAKFHDGASANRDSQPDERMGPDRGTVADPNWGTDEDRRVRPQIRKRVGRDHAAPSQDHVIANLGEIWIVEKAGQEYILANLRAGRIRQQEKRPHPGNRDQRLQ